MTRVEAEAAMETAKQAELISVHADRSAPTSKPTFKNKKSKGRGGGKGGGGKAFCLRLLPQQQQRRRRRQQQQQSAASPSAPPASLPRQQRFLSRTRQDKGGKGGKGKGQ